MTLCRSVLFLDLPATADALRALNFAQLAGQIENNPGLVAQAFNDGSRVLTGMTVCSSQAELGLRVGQFCANGGAADDVILVAPGGALSEICAFLGMSGCTTVTVGSDQGPAVGHTDLALSALAEQIEKGEPVRLPAGTAAPRASRIRGAMTAPAAAPVTASTAGAGLSAPSAGRAQGSPAPHPAPHNDILSRVAERLARGAAISGQAIAAARIPRILKGFPEFKASELKGQRWFGHRSLKDLAISLTQRSDLLELRSPGDDPQQWELSLSTGAAPFDEAELERRRGVLESLRGKLAGAQDPLPLPDLLTDNARAVETMEELIAIVRESGYDSMDVAEIGAGYLFAPGRHDVRVLAEQELPPLAEYPEELLTFMKEMQQIAGLPPIGADEYYGMFEAIYAEIKANGFPGILNLSKAVRDRCRDENLRVARSYVNFVLNAYVAERYFLNNETAHPDALADRFFDIAAQKVKDAGRSLSADETELLKDMIGVGEYEDEEDFD